MLQINYIIEHQQDVIDRLKIKNFDASEILPKLADLNIQRKS